MPHIICAAEDPQWLAERRKRVTASDMHIFLGTAPSFIKETRQSLIENKLQGREREFDDRARRKSTHGRAREKNAIEMASALLGFPMVSRNIMVGNERWPYLAATLDGMLFPWLPSEPQTDYTSQVGLALEVHEVLRGVGAPVMAEVKVSDSGHRYKDKDGPRAGLRAWVDYSPDYHREQVQTGLWMTGLEDAVLIGCLGGDELIAWYHRRDPAFDTVLDEANREAGELLAPLWHG